MATAYNRVLSTSLAEGVINWFKQHFHYTKDGEKQYYIHPNNMYAFPHTQMSLNEMPALTCWLTKDKTVGNYWAETGTVHLDVTFNTYNQLANLAKQFNEVLSAIRGQLLGRPEYILNFLQDYTPALQLMPTLSETDMSKYKEALRKKEASYIHSFEMKYMISLIGNQKALWKDGFDYYSPYDQVYHDADVQTELIIKPFEE